MGNSLSVNLIDPEHSDWSSAIQQIRCALGAPHNPLLLPDHFLKVVLPKLGGSAMEVVADQRTIGYGFLFPRRQDQGDQDQGDQDQDRLRYTLRYHPLPDAPPVDRTALVNNVQGLFHKDSIFYDPTEPQAYVESHQPIGTLDFGHPGADEVAKVRDLQQRIWGNPPDALYPADIHSQGFGLATSLVARAEAEPVAFLFGFYKFGGAALPERWQERLNRHLRLESQTMGVSSTQRGQRIGYTLKRLQAQQAQQDGIDIINWTADPLQYPNAALNFSLLRAVAYEFAPNLYELHNQLNQVAASRFSLTWLVNSDRVHGVYDDPGRTGIVQVDAFPEIVRVNEGWQRIRLNADAPLIAVEIPHQWSQLQQTHLEEARAWRMATDQVFQQYVGKELGQYMITAAGVDGVRRYLIGERVDELLLERLVRSSRSSNWME
jgi:predicted GNAT superfamily acetyltransferase